MTTVPHIAFLFMGDFQRLKGEMIRGAKIASTDLINRLDGSLIEWTFGNARNTTAVLDVRFGFSS